jgi:hypothetical protein
MERTGRESTAVAGAVALGLAVVGGASLVVAEGVGFLTPEAEAVFTLSVIAGWVLLVWSAVVATIVAAIVAVSLVRASARRRPRRAEVALVVATAIVIAISVAAHPPFGSGSSSATGNGSPTTAAPAPPDAGPASVPASSIPVDCVLMPN